MSPPANERGGHARPRGPFAPRPRDSGGPGRPDEAAPGQHDAIPARPADPEAPGSYGSGPLGEMPGPNGNMSSQAAGPPGLNLDAPGQTAGVPDQIAGMPGLNGGPPGQNGRGRPARHVASGPAARPGRKSSPATRRRKRSRIAALVIVVVGVLITGLATGFGSELSAEPTAQAFLFDWQQQHYAAASTLTTAAPATVTADLRGAFAQLDAAQLFLSMKSVVQHGDTAEASFMATVDLAQQGRVWTYRGQFGLRDGEAKIAACAAGGLFPNEDVGQRRIRLPQQCIADAGEAAKEAQIELSFAAVPSVVAGRGGVLQDRH